MLLLLLQREREDGMLLALLLVQAALGVSMDFIDGVLIVNINWVWFLAILALIVLFKVVGGRHGRGVI